ncbi:MAG: hypothetical protein QNJ97_27235 [Myxococcota bacterium]|nr:hypothetical protein [Myxococcota bacterium]
MQSFDRSVALCWLIVCTVLIPGLLSAGSDEKTLSGQEIVDRMLKRAEANKKKALQYTYKQIMEIEKLDKSGKLDELETRVYEAVIIDGERYERLIEKNDSPLNAEEQEEEQEREAKFRKRQKDKKAGKEVAEEDGMSLEFNRDNTDRFIFETIGKETIAGRPAYVVTIRIDPTKKLPEEKDTDRFLNALEGKMWVDAADFEIVRVKARLTRTVRFGLGLLAYFKKVVFSFEQRRSTSGAWYPASGRVYIWGRSLIFKPIRQRQKITFADFKKVG